MNKALMIVATLVFLVGSGTGFYFGYDKGFGDGHWEGADQGQRAVLGAFGFHEAPRKTDK